MFPISKVLLTFAFLVTVINSTPHPDTEIFDLNPDVAPSMDMFPDEISYDDDLIPIGDQDYLFAGNPGTSESCSAEGWQPFSAIGRLRQRRGSPAGSEGGNSCISPSEGGNSGAASDESLNTDLLRLPIVEDLVVPAYEGRPDICPPLVFEDRDIPLCSTDNLITQLSFNGRNTVLPNAKVCKLSLSLKDLITAKCGGMGIRPDFCPS